MDFDIITKDTYSTGENVLNNVNGILMQEEYQAKMEIYINYLNHQRELAEIYLKQYREINEKIFNQAVEILDVAIDNANVELAQVALDSIKTLKKMCPQFYNSFNHILLG